MRPDQIERLKELSEKLADHFLMEADPVEWPGGGSPPSSMTQQERGDSYWCKKNAMATGGVLRYTLDIVKSHSTPGSAADDTDPDADMDKKIREAERRASAAVNQAIDKARKRNFDIKTHGK
jgi:hypothetical protein